MGVKNIGGVWQTFLSTVKYIHTEFKTTQKFAVVELCGVQKLLQEGRYYTSERLQISVGQKFHFGRVLAFKFGGELIVGKPWLERVFVEAEIIEEFQDDKEYILKSRIKKNS